MLNDTDVLSYVKTGLGYPLVTIELDDDQLRNIIKLKAIREFSQWVPDIAITKMLTSDNVEGHNNRFYFYDNDDADIIGVVDVFAPLGHYMMHGIPLSVGPKAYDTLPDYMVNLWRGETAYEYSGSHITFNYIRPNIIEIYAGSLTPEYFIVKYMRSHLPDYSTIPYGLSSLFLDLALAHCKIAIGELRSKYSSYTTTMGEIPINTDLKSDGENLRQRVIEDLRTIPMSVTIDVD